MKTILVKKDDYKKFDLKAFKKSPFTAKSRKVKPLVKNDKTIFALDGITTLYKGGCFK